MLNVTGVEAIDPDVELLEQGLDSMSATEMIRHLEEEFKIEIEPDVLFDYPLIGQFAAEIENGFGSMDNESEKIVTRESVDKLVNGLFFQLPVSKRSSRKSS